MSRMTDGSSPLSGSCGCRPRIPSIGSWTRCSRNGLRRSLNRVTREIAAERTSANSAED
jgi:hypothetical protein